MTDKRQRAAMSPIRSSTTATRLCGLLTLCLLSALPGRADFLDSIQKALDRAGLFQGVRISGQNTMTLQQNFLQGSRSAFEGQRWDTGNFYRQSSLHLEGPIWKEFGFQLDLSASGWGQDYTRWVLGYVGHNTALYFGDLNINLPGNEFASFSRSLRGWQLDQVLPNRGLMRAFYSQEEGFTRRETFSGNNTSGPYFLTYTPIIEGSLRVKVDEVPQELGTDYRVDYQTGELNFEPTTGPPKLIPSTSTIAVSYQSAGYYSQAGKLSGVRAEMPFRRGRGLVGLTVLRQDRPEAGRGDTAAYQEDIYNGSGTTGPFDTNYRPILADGAVVVYRGKSQTIEQALVVLVDDVPQKEGVNYLSYRQIGRIIFLQPVPPTALVRIQYYYSLGTASRSADLEIRGLDLSYQVSKHLTLASQYARSIGGASGASGSALSGLLTFSRPGLNLTAEFRDMEPTFSYLDSVGFYRQEKGLNLRLDWRPGRYFTVYDTYSNVKTNNGYSFGYSGYAGYAGDYSPLSAQALRPLQDATTPAGLDIRSKRHSLGVSFVRPRWPSVQWTRDDMSNSGGAGGNSSYSTDRFEVRHDFGQRLRTQFQWQHNRQEYGRPATVGVTANPGSSSTQSLVSLTWTPAEKLSLSANLNSARSHGTSATVSGVTPTSSSSSALQLSARWQPSQRVALNLDRTATKSDGLVSSGFYGGYGGGGYYSGGGGWPGPIAGAGFLPAQAGAETERPRYQDVSTTLGITYQPSERLNLGVNLSNRKYLSSGGMGYLADSDQTTRNLFATWRFSPTLSLTASLGSDRLAFLDPGKGAISNNMYTASFNYQPENTNWGLGLTLNKQTGASPVYLDFGSRQRYLTVGTDFFDVSAQVRYRLAQDSSLYCNLGLSDFASGYAAFKKNTAELGWERTLGKNTRMSLGYRFIKNLAGRPTSPLFTGAALAGQDYLANTFALSISTTFSGGVGGGSFAAPAASDYAGLAGGFGSSTALATFGGYRPAFGGGLTEGVGGYPGGFAGAGFGGGGGFGSGYGGYTTGAFGRTGGFSGLGTGYGAYGSPQGFATGLGQFRQKEPQGAMTTQPSLGWTQETPGLGAPEAPSAGAGEEPPPTWSEEFWHWQEGLSRWDLGSPGAWW